MGQDLLIWTMMFGHQVILDFTMYCPHLPATRPLESRSARLTTNHSRLSNACLYRWRRLSNQFEQAGWVVAKHLWS
jgi:hypothetical protein